MPLSVLERRGRSRAGLPAQFAPAEPASRVHQAKSLALMGAELAL
jgi:hypothetical protein